MYIQNEYLLTPRKEITHEHNAYNEILTNIGDVPYKEQLFIDEIKRLAPYYDNTYKIMKMTNGNTTNDHRVFENLLFQRPFHFLIKHNYNLNFPGLISNVLHHHIGILDLGTLAFALPEIFDKLFLIMYLHKINYEKMVYISLTDEELKYPLYANALKDRLAIHKNNNGLNYFFINGVINKDNIKYKSLKTDDKIGLFTMHPMYWLPLLTNLNYNGSNSRRLISIAISQNVKGFLSKHNVEYIINMVFDRITEFDFKYIKELHWSYIPLEFTNMIMEKIKNKFPGSIESYISNKFVKRSLPHYISNLPESIFNYINFDDIKFRYPMQKRILIRRFPILLNTINESHIKEMTLNDWRVVLKQDVNYGEIMFKYKKRVDTFDTILTEFPKLKLLVCYV